MITVKNLVRCFGSTTAVDDVNFTIGRGEIVGLLGHNGAGKSTAMKLLTGYLEPDSGTISVDGLDVTKETRQVQAKIGYLPENLPIYPDMTLIDYLEFAADIRGLEPAKRRTAIRRTVDATGLSERALDPINTLSRGYRQRVGVAQAILHKPDILILDEPTNGLDPDQTLAMRELIRDLAGHATIILSTHIMQEVDALCDRVLIMRGGKVALDEQIAELRNSKRLHIGTNASLTQIQKVIGHLGRLTRGTEENSVWLESKDLLTTELSAEITKTLVQADIEMHALHPERRDLEQVFRQISAGKNLQDA